MIFRGKIPDYVAAAFWEEHCIECGAPACYGTCEKYVAAPDGRCRRFHGGIRHVLGRGCYVHFKEWGKLELRYTGRMIGKVLAWFLRLVGIEYWKSSFRYRVVCHFSRRNVSPEVWVVSFSVKKPVDLVAAITDEDKGDLFTKRISVGPGKHRYEFKIPKLGGTTYFRISAIDGTSCPVFFRELSVGARKQKVSSAEFVKCVVWDLDNTLWDGILANDGSGGVKLRRNTVDVVKELDRRGILNTICSKNDFDEAWGKLKSLGIHEYFVFPQINWMPKSENIRQIAKDINIGLDSLAFIDDSAHERGEVKENLPTVRVFTDLDIGNILGLKCFSPPLSSESHKRRFSYMAEMSRRSDERSFDGNHDAFLRACEIKLMLMPLHDDDSIKRCWELVNRTNQLTLAARRYTEDSFRQLISRPCTASYAIRCNDKYGDYGIVGFVAFSSTNDAYAVDEFVMSCRVAKKKCEFGVIDYLAAEALKNGCKKIFADVIPTGRNKALIDAFDEMPGIVKSSTGKGIRYSLELKGRVRPAIPVEVCRA